MSGRIGGRIDGRMGGNTGGRMGGRMGGCVPTWLNVWDMYGIQDGEHLVVVKLGAVFSFQTQVNKD